GRQRRAGPQVVDDLDLLVVVTLQVDQPLVDHEGAGADQLAGGHRVGPSLGGGPGQAGQGLGAGGGEVGEVDRDRPGAYGPRGDRGGQHGVLVVLAADPGQGAGDVHVGGGEHPGVVELAEGAGGVHGQPAVVLDRLEHLEDRHAAPSVVRPSSRSDTAVTR